MFEHFVGFDFQFISVEYFTGTFCETNGRKKLWYKTLDSKDIVQKNEIKWNFCAQCLF